MGHRSLYEKCRVWRSRVFSWLLPCCIHTRGRVWCVAGLGLPAVQAHEVLIWRFGEQSDGRRRLNDGYAGLE